MAIAPPKDLAWLLADLAKRVPQMRSVLLLSADGLPIAAHGLDPENTDQLAATASGIWALARSAARRFDGSDTVRQVVCEFGGINLFVSAAGSGSVLTVLADREADPNVIGYEMAQLVKAVQQHLGTPTR
jgi:predicted regulator of Ras-like GTPase activity (Roadblock/LC7/MglB family)